MATKKSANQRAARDELREQLDEQVMAYVQGALGERDFFKQPPPDPDAPWAGRLYLRIDESLKAAVERGKQEAFAAVRTAALEPSDGRRCGFGIPQDMLDAFVAQHVAHAAAVTSAVELGRAEERARHEEDETRRQAFIDIVHDALWSDDHRGEDVGQMAQRIRDERNAARAEVERLRIRCGPLASAVVMTATEWNDLSEKHEAEVARLTKERDDARFARRLDADEAEENEQATESLGLVVARVVAERNEAAASRDYLTVQLAEAREAARPMIDETSEVEVTEARYAALRTALYAAPSTSLDRIRMDAIERARGLDTDDRVRFYEHDFYPLSNFSAFSILWKGVVFATSEHVYHWEKFDAVTTLKTGIGDMFSVPIRVLIHMQPSAHQAFKLAEQLRAHRRPDWDAVKVDTMRQILRAKVDQHEYVRRKLLATGERELVEDSWRDDFWGWGPNRDGKNILGKLWMEIRDEVRMEAAR